MNDQERCPTCGNVDKLDHDYIDVHGEPNRCGDPWHDSAPSSVVAEQPQPMIAEPHNPLTATPFYHSPDANVTQVEQPSREQADKACVCEPGSPCKRHGREQAVEGLVEAAKHAELMYSDLAEREGSQADRDAASNLEAAIRRMEETK